MDVNNFMIPEMGTAWINVNQRFGLNSRNTSQQNQTTIAAPQSQMIDSGTTTGSFPVNTPAVVNAGSSSTSQSNGRSIMFDGSFSPAPTKNGEVISPY
jgi:hypothetical protein